MKVNLKWVTPNAETEIVEIARVSSSREDRQAEPHKLIQYLIKNKHWSPFEMANMTLDIETSISISMQLLRHRSAAFQQLSQRYQDVTLMFDDVFEPIELRLQGKTNRQVSDDVLFDQTNNIYERIQNHLEESLALYNELIDAKVARECARFILPLCTKTNLYINGTIRTWIHLIEARDDKHAQKEVQLLARKAKKIFIEQLPIISKALGWI